MIRKLTTAAVAATMATMIGAAAQAATITSTSSYSLTSGFNDGTVDEGDVMSFGGFQVTSSDVVGLGGGTDFNSDVLYLEAGSDNDSLTWTFDSTFSFEVTDTTYFSSDTGTALGGTGIFYYDGGSEAATWELTTPSTAWSGTATLTMITESLPAVPLPAGLPLLAGGLASFAWLRRRQKRAAA